MIHFPAKDIRKSPPVIEITPLIDVVFLMLIFFMLSTTFIHENRLNIELPETTHKEGNEEDRPLVISINKESEIFWESEKLTEAELESRLQDSEEIQKRALLIQADENTPHGQVIKVFDILRRNHILRLSIATELNLTPSQPTTQ